MAVLDIHPFNVFNVARTGIPSSNPKADPGVIQDEV
jgi:hypothetical protein